MKWKKYRLKTTEEAEDIVSATLADLGIEGVEIEDKQPLTEQDIQQMFVDIPPMPEEDDGIAYLSFYLDPEEDHTELLSHVREELESLRTFLDIGEATIEESETEDKDWVNNWKQYFHQFHVDDILVIPSWEQVDQDEDASLILHIDPGTAFGTGMHETTQLCIRALKKYVRNGDRILDVGTGSGILAITALKLGAEHAVGTDLDPATAEAVSDNKKANDIPDDDFELILGNMIDDPAVREKAGYDCYDIVTANILADVLVPLTPQIVPAMKKGGIYITSGILEGYEDRVEKACRDAGLEILETAEQGEWRAVIAQKTE